MSLFYSAGLGGSAIPDSAIHQWDFSALSLNDGETVSSVPDQIGTVDLTAVGGPTFDADANGGAGGVILDGVDGGFETDSAVSFSGGGTIYHVFNYDGGGSGDRYLIESPNSPEVIYAVDTGPGDGLFAGDWVRRSNSTVQGTAVRGGFVDGANSVLRRDGAEIQSGDTGGAALDGVLEIPNITGGPSGTLSEILIYDEALPQADYESEEQRLADKYGVTLA